MKMLLAVLVLVVSTMAQPEGLRIGMSSDELADSLEGVETYTTRKWESGRYTTTTLFSDYRLVVWEDTLRIISKSTVFTGRDAGTKARILWEHTLDSLTAANGQPTEVMPRLNEWDVDSFNISLMGIIPRSSYTMKGSVILVWSASKE